jgi:hypothetical protein
MSLALSRNLFQFLSRMESFFHSLKAERIGFEDYKTRSEEQKISDAGVSSVLSHFQNFGIDKVGGLSAFQTGN